MYVCIYVHIYVCMYVRTYVYRCTLHIIIHTDILPGGPPVGTGPIDDDVAIWCEESIKK